jgi:hypothetical protein
MAIRIPWDKQETAILISACVDYNSGKITKDEAILSVSNKLRKRAVEKGIAIDEVFRNVNGISMQFMIVNGLLTGEKCSLHNASKLFVNMVDIYKNNNTEFQKILGETSNMGDLYSNNQESFSKWLTEQQTPAQVSDIYVTLYDIDGYFQREKVLTKPLFETNDINKISEIRSMITQNDKFKYSHRYKVGKYANAIGFYYTWLVETQNGIAVNSGSTSLNMAEINIKDFDYIKKKPSSDINVKYVDFDKNDTYAFTKVEFFEYFGKKQMCKGSWKQLYSSIIEKLYVDYPIGIATLRGKSIGNGTRMDIGDKKQSEDMVSPRMFGADMYVETNLNATNIVDKIRWLLNRCGVGYENLIIAYRHNNEQGMDEVPINVDCHNTLDLKEVQTKNDDEIMTINRKQFMNWLRTEQENVLEVVMDISTMNKLGLQNGIIQKSIYLIESITAIKMVFERLQRTSEFMKLNSKLQFQYKRSLDIYIKYKTESNSLDASGKNDMSKMTINKESDTLDNSEIENGLDSRFIEILKEDFDNGFRINSSIDKGRFKVFYSQRFSEELALSDEQMIKLVKKIGTIRNDRIFVKEDREQKNLMKQILDEVLDVLEQGVSCVSIDSIYQRFHIDLVDMLQIYDAEVLGEQLVKLSGGLIVRKQSYLCYKNMMPDLGKDVLNVIKHSQIPMSYDDFTNKMWHIPLDKIKHELVINKSIVQVAPETYFYALNLPVNQEELVDISNLIKHELEYKSYITDVELRNIIDDKCPNVSINTADFTTYGLRNCLGYLLKDTFSFNGAIISAYGMKLSMADVFSGYCRDREQVTVDELKKLASDMDTIIYWDAVREETIRISEDVFLRNDRVLFDIDKVDEVLDSFVENDYVSIKEIGLFMLFPTTNVKWNGYVLESFVYKYSKKYKLIHATFSASGYFGAVVKSSSIIADYRTLIVDALSNTDEWKDNESALEWLVNKGYQQRKKYSDIEKVIHEAKLIREKKKAKK